MATRVAGRYQLIRELGAGKMGRVFQAVDAETGQAVAAKILIENGDLGLQGLLRFQQEGALLSTLKHPNIVQVYSTHLEEHMSCIIMELLEGRTLRALLGEETLTLRRIKAIASQVAAALVFAHRRGIVHRDIKPDNIMVVGNDHVKVTDFGIARIIQDAVPLGTLTASGMSMGTPLYMSPEQIEGGNIDGRTDIYAFGCVLYEMVSGHPPFEGQDPLTVAFKHVHKAPSPPAQVNPEIPDAWEALILKCLAKHPDHRFQSSQTLQDALAELEDSDRPAPRRSSTADAAVETRGPAPDHSQLEFESQALMQEARNKEGTGDLKGALQQYRTALTLAPPGPTRATIEMAVARITESLALPTQMVELPVAEPGETATRPAPRSLIDTVVPPPSEVHPPDALTQHDIAPRTTLPSVPTDSVSVTHTEPAAATQVPSAPSTSDGEMTTFRASPPPDAPTSTTPVVSTVPVPAGETDAVPVLPPPDLNRQATKARTSAVETRATTATSPRARRSLSTPVLAGSLALVLLLVAGGVFVAAQRGNGPARPTPLPTAVAVVPLAPAGASSGGAFRSGQRVTLGWKKVLAASRYEVRVSEVTTEPGTVTQVVKPISTVETTHTSIAFAVVGAREYSWRVRALLRGRWTAFSRAERFSVARPAIGRPVPLTPHNGTVTTNGNVRLCWSGVSEARDYLLNVSGQRSRRLTTSCASLSLRPGSYHWSVSAQEQGAHLYTGPSSASAHFTIRSKPRPTPTPVPAGTTGTTGTGSTSGTSGTTGSSVTTGTTGTGGTTGYTGTTGTSGTSGTSGASATTGSGATTGTGGTSGSSSSTTGAGSTTGGTTGSSSTTGTGGSTSSSSSSSSTSSTSSSTSCDPLYQVC